MPNVEPKFSAPGDPERKWDVLPPQTLFALIGAEEAETAVERLKKAGMADDDLEVLRGEAAIQRLEPSATESGGVQGFISKVLHQIADETIILKDYARGLEQGMALVAVRFDAKEKEKRDERRGVIAAILLDSGGTRMSYTLDWTLTEIVERKRPL